MKPERVTTAVIDGVSDEELQATLDEMVADGDIERVATDGGEIGYRLTFKGREKAAALLKGHSTMEH
jgi:DNA-binding HxlR family transcriptional regulator